MPEVRRDSEKRPDLSSFQVWPVLGASTLEGFAASRGFFLKIQNTSTGRADVVAGTSSLACSSPSVRLTTLPSLRHRLRLLPPPLLLPRLVALLAILS